MRSALIRLTISRELPSMAVIGLSVFGSARCETTSLPPRFAISVADRELHPEHRARVAQMVTAVPHLTALDIFPVFVTKINSDSGSSLECTCGHRILSNSVWPVGPRGEIGRASCRE